MPKISSHLAHLAVCAVLVSPFKAAPASLVDSPAFSLAPKDLQQLADQQVGTATSPAVVLLDEEHWSFHPDNTIERKQHYIFKLLDQSAIQSWSSVQERWEPWHQERPLFRARVVTRDGMAHELDPKTLVDAPAASGMPQSYSDVRVLQGPLPAVEVGAIVEAELTERFTPVLGSLAFRGNIAWGVPVRSSRLTIEYPESLPLRYTADLCPDLKQTKETRDGIVHLILAFGSFDATKESDPLLPFDIPRAASITLSTGVSWNDVAARYGKVVDDRISGAPVTDFVAKALQGEKARLGIIEKLVRALHTEVRYTGVEFGDAAIVPAKPFETLSRKYGDCKDKASLLVAMLRAAGIPSYVAILHAGLDQDVAPQHPGMGMFNHAIVYVPGSPDIWIDATAEHSRVGSLPPLDEDRLALIIRPETKELIAVPESPSSANTTTTSFDYYLPDFGPSHVVESLSGTGPFESEYRDLVALLDNEDLRKQAEQQTQAQWDTKAVIKITHPPANDFTTPFQVVTDVPDTKSLKVSETGASFPLPVTNVFSGLPPFFSIEDSKDGDSGDKKRPRVAGFVLPCAFVEKLTFRTHMPPGFTLKKLPDDRTVTLGPATFTAHYVLKGQILTADISLDSHKRAYTLDEGNALKKAAIEFLRQPAPVLNLEPLGQSLLDQGHLHEGLDAFRSLAAQHNTEAVNHVRLSRAYLATGCGQEARGEAKLANLMAGDLAVTWRNLSFVYEHDLLGRKYKPGWGPTVVETALRKAMSIDPDDLSSQTELAESFSYDLSGNQFNSLDRLTKAVELLNAMGDGKIEQAGAQDMLAHGLALLGRLDELKANLDRFGSNGSRGDDRVFLTAVREGGAKAATDFGASSSGDNLKRTFLSAANLLAATGRYQQEADLAEGLGLESQLFVSAADLRKIHHIDPQSLHPDSPENLLKCFLAAQFQPGENPDTLVRFWSASAPRVRLRLLLQRSQQSMLNFWSRRGIIRSVAADVSLSGIKGALETNGDSGFRVRLTFPGQTLRMAVIREGDGFKLLGNSELPEGVARQALTDLQKGNQDVARQWLDWLREDIKVHSEDDPLGGPVFPRIWNKGTAASPAQIRYAAASLIHSEASLPILKEAINSSSDSTTRAYYDLAYTYICVYLKNWSDGLPIAKSLAAGYPGSDTALKILSQAYVGTGRVEDAEKLLKAAIANSPDDLVLKRALVNSLALGNRFRDSAQVAKQTAEAPNATPNDWNQYGWITLVAGETDEEKIHAVARAQNQPADFIQNTIAAVYAEIGKLNEARQISLQSLDSFGYKTPNSVWWYVFGRIAEQLGANSSAILFYEKADPEPNNDGPLSTSSLARKRLAVLSVDRTVGEPSGQ